MSNEGMALNFGFQISNIKFAQQEFPSRIGLHDFDVSFVDSDVNCRRSPAVDYLIDLHLAGGGIRGDWTIIKIIGDLSVRSPGEQMEGCFAGQPNPGVSLDHG